jgi:peptide deformylase
MAVLKVLTYPDKFLRHTATPVEEIDDRILMLIEDMGDTMYEEPGIGLAATQVGEDVRVIVYDVSHKDGQRKLEALINPQILSSGDEILSENEGCLSVPGYRSDVKRFGHITVEGLNRRGDILRFDARGLLAVVLQHEIDHLNGILFIDRISALKREMYKRRVKKALKKNLRN